MILRRNQVNVLMADSSIVTPEVVDALSNVQNYFYQTPNSKILISFQDETLLCHQP